MSEPKNPFYCLCDAINEDAPETITKKLSDLSVSTVLYIIACAGRRWDEEQERRRHEEQQPLTGGPS